MPINQLKSKKKDDLLVFILALKENSSHSAENSVLPILKSIQQEIYDLKTEITSLKVENTNLRNIIQTNENCSQKIKELEIASDDLAQYIRGNNIKVSGIPDIFKDDFLKIKL